MHVNNKDIQYIHFECLDSTNDWVKKNIHVLDPDRLICVTASEQTAGRGRFARKWLSPKGQNIYATLFFCLPQNSKIVSNLGQILSLACAKVLESKGFSPQIKWPNDILISRKKVSGILGEAISLNDRLGIALGIGINVDTPPQLLDKIDQPAASLSSLSNHVWTFEEILEPLVEMFAEYLEIIQREGFSPFRSQYEDLLAFKGQLIHCMNGNKPVTGICHSIDSEGRLKLVLAGSKECVEVAQTITIQSGEIFHS
jgi:BirA family transcriptional regulator, biotin operon repressor / biotin---[acetyl-CoA-carboxylase] ligase